MKTVPMYIAFSSDTPDSTITAWQSALDTMKRDGTFAAIRQKYRCRVPRCSQKRSFF